MAKQNLDPQEISSLKLSLDRLKKFQQTDEFKEYQQLIEKDFSGMIQLLCEKRDMSYETLRESVLKLQVLWDLCLHFSGKKFELERKLDILLEKRKTQIEDLNLQSRAYALRRQSDLERMRRFGKKYSEHE